MGQYRPHNTTHRASLLRRWIMLIFVSWITPFIFRSRSRLTLESEIIHEGCPHSLTEDSPHRALCVALRRRYRSNSFAGTRSGGQPTRQSRTVSRPLPHRPCCGGPGGPSVPGSAGSAAPGPARQWPAPPGADPPRGSVASGCPSCSVHKKPGHVRRHARGVK